MLRRSLVLFAMLALSVGMAFVGSNANAMARPGPAGVNLGGPVHLVGPATQGVGGIRHADQSTNWSGYADTTGRFTKASASWTQPAGHCGSGQQFAAFWVGIDGFNSSTVEQTGSEVDCIGGRAEYVAWFEMFPGPSQNYSNTVRAGDHFNATVTFNGGESFTLFIQDTTQGWSHSTNEPGVHPRAVLCRGHRRGAVLHLQWRHPAAHQLRHGQLHRLHRQRSAHRHVQLRPGRDQHGQQLGPAEGQLLRPQRRRELLLHLAAQQLTRLILLSVATVKTGTTGSTMA